MPNPIDSILSPIEISADGGTTYKVIICVASYSAPVQTQTTTTDTQCGRILGLGVISFNPTVQAVCDEVPSNVQVSYKDCLLYQVNKTLLKFRIQSPSTSTFGLAQAYYLTGQCYVTDTTLTNNTNDPVKFSVTLSGTGTLNTTIGT